MFFVRIKGISFALELEFFREVFFRFLFDNSQSIMVTEVVISQKIDNRNIGNLYEERFFYENSKIMGNL